MKRRVLLAGLGTASIGVGAAFGSGAFTSIEADRDVELNVSGDDGAQVIFQKGSGVGAERLIGDDESNAVNVIEFSQTNLNEQSTTTFENALEIKNNTDDDSDVTNISSGESLNIDVYVEDPEKEDLIGDGDEDILDFRVENDDNGSHGTIVGDGSKFESISPGDSIEVDIIVDLRADGQDSDENNLEEIDQVTFVVEANDN